MSGNFDLGKMTMVAEIQKNTCERIRVSRVKRKTGNYVDIRVAFAPGEIRKLEGDDEELIYYPTKKGAQFKADLLDEVIAGLLMAAPNRTEEIQHLVRVTAEKLGMENVLASLRPGATE